MTKKITMPLVSAGIDAMASKGHFTFVNEEQESIAVTVQATSGGTNFLKKVRADAAARLRAAADALDAMDADVTEGS